MYHIVVCTELIRSVVTIPTHRMRPWPTSTRTGNCVGRNSATFSSQPVAVALRMSHQAGWVIMYHWSLSVKLNRERAWHLPQHDASDQRNLTSIPERSPSQRSHHVCQTQSTSIPTRPHSIHGPRQSVLQWLPWLAVSEGERAEHTPKHLRAWVPVPESHVRSLLIPDVEPVQEQPEFMLCWDPTPFRFSVR